MTSQRIFNLFAFATLATILVTFTSQPAFALSGSGLKAMNFGRQQLHARLADKKIQNNRRSASKKCRSRQSSSSVPSPSPSSSHHNNPKPTTSPPEPVQTPGSGSSNSGSSNSGSSKSGLSFFHSGSKLGLAWPDGNAGYLSNLKGAKMMYTWGATCPSEASDLGITCLNQLWGEKNVDAFQEAAKTAKPPLFLTFNEPQEPGQANLDVQSGVALWKKAVKPLTDQGHAACSPATSSNPNGLTWVKDFQKSCPECTWDVTCLHWYDTSAEKFKAYVNLWHDTFGKPILVTEFALQNFNGGPQPSSGEVFAFMDEVIPWMNGQDYIYGYFPFGFMKPPTGINPNMNLLNGDGSVTSLGWTVLNKSGAN